VSPSLAIQTKNTVMNGFEVYRFDSHSPNGNVKTQKVLQETNQPVEKARIISSLCILFAKFERKEQYQCKIYSSIEDFFNRLRTILRQPIESQNAQKITN
jgi:hypothetical protein